jgi:hypothetical protein
MKKFEMWVHVDSGYVVEVEAENADEAWRKVKSGEARPATAEAQIVENAQDGEIDILGEDK